MSLDREFISESLMQCATGVADITPQQPVPLAGYIGRIGPNTGVASNLEANAVLLCEKDESILFFSADLLYFGSELSNVLKERAGLYGLPQQNVMLAASHTHFAPATDFDKPSLGSPDAAYFAYLKERLTWLVDEVMTSPRIPVRLKHCQVRNDLSVNRRRLWRFPTLSKRGVDFSHKILMAPNEKGERDDLIDALRIEDVESGDLVSLIWKFACHPVCYPLRSQVSAEYPGVAREKVRDSLCRKLPVVFWQGFAGDVRPSLVGRLNWKNRISYAIKGPGFKPVTPGEWDKWSEGVASSLLGAVYSRDAMPVSGPMAATAVELPLSDLLDGGGSGERRLGVTRLSFGTSLEVVFVGAEVCSPYLSILRDASSAVPSIFVGYVGDVFGYLPSESQVVAGGYEGKGFLSAFGYRAGFLSGFEKRVANAVASLRV